MSGALSVLGRASFIARGAELIFGSAGAVVLGDVAFDGFEIPESITIGGGHGMVVHKLPGGTRVIDAMGRDDAPIAWSGHFLGPNAVARALAVDEIRVAGRPVPLLFGSYYYTVVVESFSAEYRRDGHIPYRVSCVVLRDESAAPLLSLVTTVLQVAGDIAGAIATIDAMTSPPPMPARADGTVLPLPADALAAAQAASDEAAREGFRRGSATQLACAASLAIARASVDDAQTGAGAVTGGIAAGAHGGALVASLADFTAALGAAEQMAKLAAARGTTARAEQNAILGSI